MASGKIKTVETVFRASSTVDGAGVKLLRTFGGQHTAGLTDPFLLMDHFGSNRIEEYIAGFPWHPHRGIETVTYLLEGKVVHEDSEGNRGTIYPGDLQWMTAGSGIFHQEMPKPLDEKDPRELLMSNGMPTTVTGFQLWLNLSSEDKMTQPAYRGILGSKTPVLKDAETGTIRVIAGTYDKIEGAFPGGGRIDPTYLDVKLEEESEFTFQSREGYTCIAYLVAGDVSSHSGTQETAIPDHSAVVFSRTGDTIKFKTGTDSSGRIILISGRPLNQPVSWYGPIVMNTHDEINQALLDLKNNTFVKDKNPVFL